MFNFFEFSQFLFFMEYFLGIIILFILLVYMLIINNIFGLIISQSINSLIIFLFILIYYLISNDIINFLIDLKFNNFFINNNLIIFDLLSIIIKLLLIFLCCFFFLIIHDLLQDCNFNFLEFFIILLTNILGLFLLLVSFDLLMIFVSIELIGFSSYFLVSFKKNIYTIECAFKYLIINVISSILLLLGSFLFYYYFGTIELNKIKIIFLTFNLQNMLINWNINILIYYYNYYFNYLEIFYLKSWFIEYLLKSNFFIIMDFNQVLIELGLILICSSIFIKIGLVPYHFWVIEIYEKSNLIITFFLLIIPKLSFFVFLTRITFFFNLSILSFYLIFIGVSSIIIGSLLNLNEKNLKSILIYSSINHSGYIILGYSTTYLISLEIFFSYILIYLFSNLVIWFIILNFKKNNNFIFYYCNNICDFALLNKSNKIIAFSLLFVIFSFSGIPPFIGFFLKYTIFLSVLKNDYIFVALILAGCSFISVFYYIRLVKIFYFENINFGYLYKPLYSFNSIILYLCLFAIIFLFINPTLFYLIIYKFILYNSIMF